MEVGVVPGVEVVLLVMSCAATPRRDNMIRRDWMCVRETRQ